MTQRPRVRPVVLGNVVDRPGERLGEEDRREGERYADCDMSGADLEGAAFDSCLFERVRARTMSWRAVHFSNCIMSGLDIPELEGVETSWREVEVRDSRLGALETYDALWRQVVVENCRIGYLNLRGSRVTDVVLRGCSIDELDLGAAQATRVALVDCKVASLRVHHARLANVDLTGAQLEAIHGIGDLRGATVSGEQLLELAPHLAQHLGIAVEEPGDDDMAEAGARAWSAVGAVRTTAQVPRTAAPLAPGRW